MKNILYFALLSALFLSLLPSPASALFAYTDKYEYSLTDQIGISINSTTNTNITVSVTNSTGQVDSFTIEGSEGLITYSYSHSLPEGGYNMTLTQGSSSIKLSFRMLSEVVTYFARLTATNQTTFVDTGTKISSPSANGGNFSDLLSLSQNTTPEIYYGQVSNLAGDGRTFSFVMIDKNSPGVYDTLYMDDDINFSLYDYTEDNSTQPFTETEKSLGSLIEIPVGSDIVKFIVQEMETPTGNKILLTKPLPDPFFAAGETLNITVWEKNSTGHLKNGTTVNVSIYDSSQDIVNSTNVTINNYYGVAEIAAPSVTGKYYILANGIPSDVFEVQSFKLYGKVTDLSDNPISSLSPGSAFKVWAISKDMSDDFMNLTSVSGVLRLPTGSEQSLSLSFYETGIYVDSTASISSSSTTGEYRVIITGVDNSSNSQTFETGFTVATISMMAMTVNPKYMDQSGGEGATINAFAPESNISIALFMFNISAGGEGQMCAGGSCVNVPCEDQYFTLEIRDDNDNRYQADYSVMNISDATAMMGVEGPEGEVGSQCMMMIWGNNTWAANKGSYKVKITFSHPSYGTFTSGEKFSIQRLLATGSTVDMKGESFTFLAPSSTVFIKIDIRDMLTDELLQGNQIISAQITEMWKEYPDRKDMLSGSSYNRSTMNESINGTQLQFYSPPEEGFYVARFRFRANVTNESGNWTLEEGSGTLFFELKKYMIWAQPQGADQGQWYFKQNQNITLTVNVMDIDKGSLYGSTSAECTGCSGLIATVSSLRNEQVFKEMSEGTDYNITDGAIINSTSGATIVIVPDPARPLPTGWYGVDIELYNPDNPNETYFGWGWFEIRNFWVNTMFIGLIGSEYNGTELENYTGNYTETGVHTFQSGSDMLIGIAAFEPDPDMPGNLNVTDLEIVGMLGEDSWPPKPVPSEMYTVNDEFDGNVVMMGGQQPQLVPIRILNISISGFEPGNYLLNTRVTVEGGEQDVGPSQFDVSTFVLNEQVYPQSKMYDWPPVYSTAENITMIYTGKEFNDSQHNLTNVSVQEIYSEKEGRPLRMRYGENYTSNCSEDTCQINVSLANLNSGGYKIFFQVTDQDGYTKTSGFNFMIKNIVFGIPQINEAWTNGDRGTPEKELQAWSNWDECDNQLYMTMDNVSISGSDSDIVTLCTPPGCTAYENITLPENKNASVQYYAGKFCMGEWGRWENYGVQCTGTEVYVVSNGTVWINSSTNMTLTPARSNTSQPFVMPGGQISPPLTWNITTIGGQRGGNYLRIKHAYGIICGQGEIFVSPQWSVRSLMRAVAPSGHDGYDTFYHGASYILDWGNAERMGESPRNVYLYHNTTHLWMVRMNDSGIMNFTDPAQYSGPVPVGSMINDSFGGIWKVSLINKNQIKLYGQNVISSGAFVNTTLSSSGVFWLGRIEESQVGFFNKMTGQGGMDLDGDVNGSKDGSLNFIIMDNGSSYNTMAYSTNYNFTNTSRIVSTGAPRAQRQVGLNEKLTLLSIDPRATKVKLYSEAKGDWPDLGDSKSGDNVTIPIFVRSPSGANALANVTITYMKIRGSTNTTTIPVAFTRSNISGIGEISVNISALGHPESGKFEFGLEASTAGFTEKLEEWMWPKVTQRVFLVDSYSGYGGKVTGFRAMDARDYGEDSGTKMRDLFTANLTGMMPGYPVIPGVMALVQNPLPYPPAGCSFVPPSNAGVNQTNRTYQVDRFDNQYFIYMTASNASRIWVKQGNCNFTGAASYTEGSPLNVTLGGSLYMLYLLNATMDAVSIGYASMPAILRSSNLRMDYWGPNPSPSWKSMSFNWSGTIYNVILSNSTLNYPQCAVWNIQECTKLAWFSTGGNFTNSSGTMIGQNFTKDLYLAKVGPGPWEGVVIANFTNITSTFMNASGNLSLLPGMDVKVRDSTPTYFVVINESNLSTDLDMDGSSTGIFYSVMFDDYQDGQKAVNRMLVDDDLNITQSWWANSSSMGQDTLYYDFYSNEAGQREREGSLPQGVWSGNVDFGETQDVDWMTSPQFQTRFFDGSSMLIHKDIWSPAVDKPITFLVNSYNFNRQPLVGANVTLTGISKFGGPGGFQKLNLATNVTVINTQNQTNSGGFAMIKVVRNGGNWTSGNYMAQLAISYNGAVETDERWFNMGGGFM